MAVLKRFLSRLFNVARPWRTENDLAREIDAHLVLLEDDYRRRGMPDDEARRAARLTLGGVEQTKERHRDERSFVLLDDLRRDAAYGVRVLKRNPIVAMTAALSLTVGIGANTAIFTVANALLFRPPAGIVEPDRLVDIGMTRDFGGFNPGSYPTYLDVRERATTLDGVFARPMSPRQMSFGLENTTSTDHVFAQFVTLNYFEVLGAQAARGRYFGRGDSERAGASPIVVLNHGFWKRRFNSDPDALGLTLRLNGQAFMIVGVAPEGFQGTAIAAPDLWLPLNMMASAPDVFGNRSSGWLVMGGRLKSGVPLAVAAAEVAGIGQALLREYPDQLPGTRGLTLQTSSPVPGNRSIVALLALLLMGLVSLILFVACANVSGVLLARAAARRQEIAVRLAMGAGRFRLVRQLLTETLILFALGGIGGIVLARVTTTVVTAWLPSLPFPIGVSLALDGRVVAFVVVLSLVAALASGLLPALQASNADVVASLKDDTGSIGRAWLRHAFVVLQVALTMVLILGAGFFIRALERAGSTSPGFDPNGVELVTLDLSMARYTDSTGPRFWSELIDRVRKLPAVQSASLARSLPGGFEEMEQGIAVPGRTPPDGQPFFSTTWNVIEPDYFRTLRIPIVAGRDFTAADHEGTMPVAIISQATARLFWSNQNPVGQYLQQSVRKAAPRTLQVIGVVADIKSSSLIDGLAQSFVYVPLQQQYQSEVTSTMTIAVRTMDGRSMTGSIRALVASLDPALPLMATGTLRDSVELGLTPQRVVASISSSLGLFGLLLAALGTYGVMAFMVTRRVREFGIRVAMGATAGDILRIVIGRGLALIAIGCAIGMTLGAGAARVLSGFLYGVSAFDPVIFAGAAALFAVVGLAACYGPARRATSVDPLVALRRTS